MYERSAPAARRGQTLVEYAIAITLISLVSVLALFALGPTIANMMTTANDAFAGIAPGGGPGNGPSGPSPSAPPDCAPLDTDGDGTPDVLELAQGSDPNDPNDYDHSDVNAARDHDADADGFSDYDEFVDGTNPNVADIDSDGDGFPDAAEDLWGSDKFDPDSAPWDIDTDNDGLADYYETAFGSDPNDADSQPEDSDGDGFLNGEEVGFWNTNPSSAAWNSASRPDYRWVDTDGDGVLDGLENYFGSDPNDADSAPWTLDSDSDGYSDYDEFWGCSDPGDADSHPNLDSDGDGYSDDEEIAAGTDPHFYNDYPGHRDHDHDGYSDDEEIAAGSDPNDADSYPGSEPSGPIAGCQLVDDFNRAVSGHWGDPGPTNTCGLTWTNGSGDTSGVLVDGNMARAQGIYNNGQKYGQVLNGLHGSLPVDISFDLHLPMADDGCAVTDHSIAAIQLFSGSDQVFRASLESDRKNCAPDGPVYHFFADAQVKGFSGNLASPDFGYTNSDWTPVAGGLDYLDVHVDIHLTSTNVQMVVSPYGSGYFIPIDAPVSPGFTDDGHTTFDTFTILTSHYDLHPISIDNLEIHTNDYFE